MTVFLSVFLMQREHFHRYDPSSKKVAPLLVHQHFNVRRIKKTVLFTFYVMFRIVNGN